MRDNYFQVQSRVATDLALTFRLPTYKYVLCPNQPRRHTFPKKMFGQDIARLGSRGLTIKIDVSGIIGMMKVRGCTAEMCMHYANSPCQKNKEAAFIW